MWNASAVKSTPNPEDAARLDTLAYQAKNHALHMTRSAGSVPPTVIADTAEGFVFCMPSGMPNEAAKNVPDPSVQKSAMLIQPNRAIQSGQSLAAKSASKKPGSDTILL
jgi:hypothetical protein